MVLDNEICILNGDLNYRIDAMSRDAVVKSVRSGIYSKLLERDQLLVSRRRNPQFCLLVFHESRINFAPTYKYDIGSDSYDTSEKRRAPAWCDRILYRGAGNIKPLTYCRHELRISDHRPVSATFKMRVKQVLVDKRQAVMDDSKERFMQMKRELSKEARYDVMSPTLRHDAIAC